MLWHSIGSSAAVLLKQENSALQSQLRLAKRTIEDLKNDVNVSGWEVAMLWRKLSLAEVCAGLLNSNFTRLNERHMK